MLMLLLSVTNVVELIGEVGEFCRASWYTTTFLVLPSGGMQWRREGEARRGRLPPQCRKDGPRNSSKFDEKKGQ